MSRALAAVAARVVGRRVRLCNGATGTVTRVTGAGLSVTIAGVRADDIAEWID